MKSIGSRFNMSSLPVMRLVCFMLIFCGVCFGYAHASNNPGYWIAVTPAGLKTSIEPLAEHRMREGLDVTVVTAEDIYKAESSMNEQASAIRDYLDGRYSELDGDIYVLLVGAGTVPGKDDAFTLPALSGQLGRMEQLPSDFRYVSGSDGKPGQAVLGRLPGRSTAEIIIRADIASGNLNMMSMEMLEIDRQ